MIGVEAEGIATMMRRLRWAGGIVTAAVLVLASLETWPTTLAADEPPPLAPPAQLPTVKVPHPLPDAPAMPPGPLPVLVVPGLPVVRRTAPPRSQALLAPPSELNPETSAEAGPPPLIGPGGDAVSTPRGAFGSPTPAPRANDGPPLFSTEPVAEGANRDVLRLEPGVMDPFRGGTTLRSTPNDPPSREAESRRPQPPPRRRFFGLLPPAPTSAPVPGPRIDDDPVRVAPSADPDADAALKLRLEQQIRKVAGNPLRALDVRVVDRDVFINARVLRFWQKRPVKRDIEALPTLKGYRVRVEVTD